MPGSLDAFGRFEGRDGFVGDATQPIRGGPIDAPAVTEHGLADVLVELTDTLGEQFDAGSLLHDLASAAVQFLDVDVAGVLLSAENGRLVPVAATDLRAERLASLQAETDAGPAPESVHGLTCVSSPDLEREDERWAPFVQEAIGTGFRAVFAVPMSLHDDVVGGLLLLRQGTGALSDDDRRTARLLATAAATGLVHRRAVNHLETVNGQLQQALTSRIAIEQAKGFLAARLDLTPDDAFKLLRAHARRRRQLLIVIAEAVMDRRLDLTRPLPPRAGG